MDLVCLKASEQRFDRADQIHMKMKKKPKIIRTVSEKTRWSHWWKSLRKFTFGCEYTKVCVRGQRSVLISKKRPSSLSVR